MTLKNVVYIQAKNGVSAQARYQTLVSTGTLDGHTYDPTNDYRIESNENYVKALNASDIDPTNLTTDQFDAIRGGTFVNGSLTVTIDGRTNTQTILNPMFYPCDIVTSTGKYGGYVRFTGASQYLLIETRYFISSDKKTLTISTGEVSLEMNARTGSYNFRAGVMFNGKKFPSTFPTDLTKAYTLAYASDGTANMSWEDNPNTPITTAPTADNTSGALKIVVLDSEPAATYDGYIYYIKEGN